MQKNSLRGANQTQSQQKMDPKFFGSRVNSDPALLKENPKKSFFKKTKTKNLIHTQKSDPEHRLSLFSKRINSLNLNLSRGNKGLSEAQKSKMLGEIGKKHLFNSSSSVPKLSLQQKTDRKVEKSQKSDKTLKKLKKSKSGQNNQKGFKKQLELDKSIISKGGTTNLSSGGAIREESIFKNCHQKSQKSFLGVHPVATPITTTSINSSSRISQRIKQLNLRESIALKREVENLRKSQLNSSRQLKSLRIMESSFQQLQNEKFEYNLKIQRIEKEKETLFQQLNQSEEECGKLRLLVSDLEAKNRNLGNFLEEAKGDLEGVTKAKIEAECRSYKLEGELKVLKTSQRLSVARGRVSLSEQSFGLKNQQKTPKEATETSKGTSKTTADERSLSELNHQRNALQMRADLEASLLGKQNLQAIIRSQKKELSAIKAELSQTLERLTESQNRQSDADKRLKAKSSEKAKLQTSLDQQKTLVDSFTNEKIELTQKIEKLKIHSKRLESEKNEREEDILKLIEENERIDDAFKNIEREKTKYMNLSERLKKQLETDRRRLVEQKEDALARLGKMEFLLRGTKEQVCEERNLREELSTKVRSLEEELQNEIQLKKFFENCAKQAHSKLNLERSQVEEGLDESFLNPKTKKEALNGGVDPKFLLKNRKGSLRKSTGKKNRNRSIGNLPKHTSKNSTLKMKTSTINIPISPIVVVENSKVEELSKKVEILKESLSSSQAQYEAIILEFKEEIQILQEKEYDLKSNSKRLEIENEAYSTQIESLNASINAIDSQKSDLALENQDLRRRLNCEEQKSRAQKKVIEEIRNRINTELLIKISNLELKIREKDENLNGMFKELDEFKLKYSKIKSLVDQERLSGGTGVLSLIKKVENSGADAHIPEGALIERRRLFFDNSGSTSPEEELDDAEVSLNGFDSSRSGLCGGEGTPRPSGPASVRRDPGSVVFYNPSHKGYSSDGGEEEDDMVRSESVLGEDNLEQTIEISNLISERGLDDHYNR